MHETTPAHSDRINAYFSEMDSLRQVPQTWAVLDRTGTPIFCGPADRPPTESLVRGLDTIYGPIELVDRYGDVASLVIDDAMSNPT